MRNEEEGRKVPEEGDVVVPDAYRALALGMSPELWEDARCLLPYLDNMDLGRAFRMLVEVQGLGNLLTLGPDALTSLGMSDRECALIQSLPGIANRLLCARTKMSDHCSREEFVNQLVYRSTEGWSQVTAGVVAWDSQGRRVADRLLALGTTSGAALDLRQALRISLSAGAVSMAVWVYQPTERIVVKPQDKAYSDEIRTMGAAVSVRIEDVILVASSGHWVSLADLEGWVD